VLRFAPSHALLFAGNSVIGAEDGDLLMSAVTMRCMSRMFSLAWYHLCCVHVCMRVRTYVVHAQDVFLGVVCACVCMHVCEYVQQSGSQKGVRVCAGAGKQGFGCIITQNKSNTNTLQPNLS
jgi:hypothetical protein